MSSPTPAPTHDGRRVLLHVGLVVAFLGAVGSGLASYLAATFTIWDPVDPAAYREAAIAVGVVAVVVALLGAWVLWELRASPALGLVLALGVLVLGFVAVDARESAASAAPDRDGYHQQLDPGNVGGAVLVAAVVPTGWPLLAFGVGATVLRVRRTREVRATSSRAPRSPQVPSSGPGRPPST